MVGVTAWVTGAGESRHSAGRGATLRGQSQQLVAVALGSCGPQMSNFLTFFPCLLLRSGLRT